MTSFIDPEKLDPKDFIDSRYQEPFWWRFQTPLMIGSIIYWLLSVASFAWLLFGVDPNAELPIWMIGVMLLTVIGLCIFPIWMLVRSLKLVADWISPPEFKP